MPFPGPMEDRLAIREVYDTYGDASSQGDPETVLSCRADDGRFQGSPQDHLSGRDLPPADGDCLQQPERLRSHASKDCLFGGSCGGRAGQRVDFARRGGKGEEPETRLTDLMKRTSVTRRMGPVGSANWHAMLDAAEATLLEEGYGALTSRRIAERVGVKQRLIYYYFQTMDEIIVETFRRMSIRELERMRNTLATDRPLRELWDVCIHTTDSRITSEFMALAYRSESLRLEVINFIEESRTIQVEAICRSLSRTNTAAPLDPGGLALLATGVSLAMTRESALGVRTGNGSILTMIANFLDIAEPQNS